MQIPALSACEQMAQYSKQLWPGLPTIVRAEPSYLGSNHRYLDAAWAQYLARRGNVDDYIKRNVPDAQQRGLGLVVGLGAARQLVSLRLSQLAVKFHLPLLRRHG